MPGDMRLEYEPTFEDQLALDRARRSVWNKVPGFALFAIFGALCFGVGISGFLSGSVQGWWVLPALFAGVAIGAPFLARLERHRAWRGAVGIVRPRVLVEFSEQGVFIASVAERAFLELRAFTHYRETKDLFLLYQGPGFMRFFPRRAFGGEAGVESFRMVLAEKVVRTKYVPETPAFPVLSAGPETPSATPPEVKSI